MAGPIRKVNNKFSLTKAEKTLTSGIDEIFGDGSDGSVTISSGQTVYLSSDMYYEDLTVESGATLFTNGFRIFVNGTLTNNGTIGMPSNLQQTANSSTISGRSGTAGKYRWGEGSIEAPLDDSKLSDLDVALSGYLVTADGYIHPVAGGDPGEVPEESITEETDGGEGEQGAPGTRPFAQPGDPGGPGSPGNPGTPGSSITPGVSGVKGDGGGLVLLVAKNIDGSGSIQSFGRSSSSGNPSSDGPDGTPGTPGSPAPDLPSFSNLGSPYDAGVNAGTSTIPSSSHPHPARTGATTPLIYVTGKDTHNAVVSGGTYNVSSHSHGDVYHEDDLYDPATGSPFPTSGVKYNSQITTGTHTHPAKGTANIHASVPGGVFQNSPNFPSNQNPADAPDSNVITNHSAVYTPSYFNIGFYHHAIGPTSVNYDAANTLHHGNVHVPDLNDPAIFPGPGSSKGNLSPTHAPHTAFTSNHYSDLDPSPVAPIVQTTNVNANAFAGPHNAPITPANVNIGHHTHGANSNFSNQPNANKHVLDGLGHHPSNVNLAHNAVITNHHNEGNHPAGYNPGGHYHGAGSQPPATILADPNAGNAANQHHHNAGHHQGNPGHHPHAAGSHGPNPKNSNSHHYINPGSHYHGSGGHGPKAPHNANSYHSHNAGNHPHAQFNAGNSTDGGQIPISPVYPRNNHNHNGAHVQTHPSNSPAKYGPFHHYIKAGHHPHGAGGHGPSNPHYSNVHNGNAYHTHNAGHHNHGSYNYPHTVHPFNGGGAPFGPTANHNHNANHTPAHNAGNHPYHNPHGSHNAGSHSPNPTSNHNTNANTASNHHHNAGTYNHPGGGPSVVSALPVPVRNIGHSPLAHNASGHHGTHHPSGHHAAYGADNSPAYLNANSSTNPPSHTAGNMTHSTYPYNTFHGTHGTGGLMTTYGAPTGPTANVPTGHSGTRDFVEYGAGNAPTPVHHLAGNHHHTSGLSSETSIGYLIGQGAPYTPANTNVYDSHATLNKGYWPSGQHTHATGPISPLNSPTAITAAGLGEFDFYGPLGSLVGYVGAGNHTGTYSPQGHNPGSHSTTRLAHFVGKASPVNLAAHTLQSSPVNSPAYITLRTPEVQFAQSNTSINPISHPAGTHDLASYALHHGTGGSLPAHGHSGSPYPSGFNTSFDNIDYFGGAGGAGGAGGSGGDVSISGSTNPGSTGGAVIVSRSSGNVQNQFSHSNFSKIVII